MPTAIVLAVSTRGTSAAIRSITNLDGRTSKLGKTLAGLAVGGAVAATAAIVKFGAASVSAASDSQQSIGATETVFGRFADTVIKRSKRAADAVGLSANEYRELANVTGASLAAAGLPIRKVTDLTGQLTKRAADMAATFGGTTKEAIESVSSLLRGEADPIERYGVSIKQSDVNARLAAKGLGDLEGKARKVAEQQARLELLFKQTGKSAGAFARESDTLAGAQQRLDAKVENVEAKFGKLLIPALTDLVNLTSRKVIPAAEDLADWLSRNRDEIADFAGSVKDVALPQVRALAEVAQALAGFLADLPPEVRTFGAEAAVAALVLGRLNSAMASTSLSSFAANLRNAETRTAALGRAARTAAGVAGVLALTKSTEDSTSKLGVFESVAGGAALGFSVGGPWGAAVGLLGGVAKATSDVTSHQRALRDAAEAAAPSIAGLKSEVADYKATLDDTTGAITKLTRQEVLRTAQANGILSITNKLDVAGRDVVGAILGQEGATKRLTSAFDKHFGSLTALEQVKLSQWLRDNTSAFAHQQAQVREDARATETWRKALKGLPPKVQTAVKQLGAEASAKELRKLKRQYDLTPKQIRTIIAATGTDVTIRKVKGVWSVFEEGKRVRPGLDKWTSELLGAATEGKRGIDQRVGEINRSLSTGTRKAKADLAPFRTSVTNALQAVRGAASSGAAGVGGSIGSGVNSGIAPWIPVISATVRRAVDQAIEAGRQEARAHSPSQRTMELGSDLGEGLARGLDDSLGRTGKAGRKLIDQLLRAATSGARDLQDALRRVLEAHKLKGAELRKALKSLDDESKALIRNAQAQDRVNRKLEKARAHLSDLRQQAKDYARSIRESVVATGDVTQLGKDEAGTATTGGIIDQLRAKVRDAQRFADLIRRLTSAGLNATSLQQLLAAGVEGGLSTAEALVSGGSDAIDEINQLTQQLTQTGTQLGNSAADTMYDAGIQAAQGLVDGLEARAEELDKIADRLAKRLIDAIRKALKIKSPSGVFRDLGRLTGEGLRLGLEDTHANRIGEVFARDLVRGVGEPKITARGVLSDFAAGESAPTVRIKLSASQLTDLQRGREVTADVTAFGAAGGRRIAKVATS